MLARRLSSEQRTCSRAVVSLGIPAKAYCRTELRIAFMTRRSSILIETTVLGTNPILSGHVNQMPTKTPSTTRAAPQLIYPLEGTRINELKELLRIAVQKPTRKSYQNRDIACHSRENHTRSKPTIDMSYAHNQLIISQPYQYCVGSIID